MNENHEIASFLCMYPATKKVCKQYGLSSHHTRIMLSIYYLYKQDIKITRQKVSKHSYIWLSVLHHNVGVLIELGMLKPLIAPRFYLRFTPLGLGVINDILLEFKTFERKLSEGPKVLNKPPKRK